MKLNASLLDQYDVSNSSTSVALFPALSLNSYTDIPLLRMLGMSFDFKQISRSGLERLLSLAALQRIGISVPLFYCAYSGLYCLLLRNCQLWYGLAAEATPQVLDRVVSGGTHLLASVSPCDLACWRKASRVYYKIYFCDGVHLALRPLFRVKFTRVCNLRCVVS